MFQLTYLFVGLVAVLASGATISTRIDQPTRVVTGAFALVCWAYWALQSFSVEVVSNGQRVTETYSGLAAVGAVAAAVMLLSVVRLAFTSTREQFDTNPIEDM